MKDNVLNSILIVAAFSAILLIAIGNDTGNTLPALAAAAQSPQTAAVANTAIPTLRRSDDAMLVAFSGR